MLVESEIIRELEAAAPGAEVRALEPMKAHTSLRLGGPADFYVLPSDPEELRAVLGVCAGHGLPYFILGGGTNLLVRDGGVEGVVINPMRMRDVEHVGQDALLVGAGLGLHELLARSRRAGLSGVEGLAGIPGQVGGAIAGNVGSFGSEIKDVVEGVVVMGPDGSLDTLNAEALRMQYRRSELPKGAVIVEALMRFRKSTSEAVWSKMRECLARKNATQPLGKWSAGCVFKNPPGDYAARLIDEAGCKGLRRGGIEVSLVHAGFLINTGGGTAAEFLSLMEEVRETVQREFSITLETEIRVVGRDEA